VGFRYHGAPTPPARQATHLDVGHHDAEVFWEFPQVPVAVLLTVGLLFKNRAASGDFRQIFSKVLRGNCLVYVEDNDSDFSLTRELFAFRIRLSQ
jgi:hypothetical protein